MSGLLGGGSSTTVVQNVTPDPSPQELELIALNRDLAQRQLANVEALQPFQQELLSLSLENLRREKASTAALDAAVSPDEQAKFARDEFLRAQRLGPMQDELLKLQLDQIRSGGAATPEQLARIKKATDAGILAGSADIDASTQRGIGLIADELANARGLRLSDSPIKGEAALLAREGEIQKGSLTKNLRAAEATSALNYPLAANQVMSGINLSQQNLASATQNFQAQLRQQAFQNRLAMTGQTGSTGIGLAGIGSGNGALNALTTSRMNSGTRTTTGDNPVNLQGIGAVASGAAAIAPFLGFSDRRLKDDYGVVGTTKSGTPVHVFRFKGEKETPLRLGVMADEADPKVVYEHSSGFKVVDYARV